MKNDTNIKVDTAFKVKKKTGFTLAEVLIAKRVSGKSSLLNLSRASELKAPSNRLQKLCAFTLAEVTIAKRVSGKSSLLNLSRESELKAPSNRFFKLCAFTLAEVLITLGVIGIVAALTIPVLMNWYQEQQAVSAVKETYALVSQAIKQWENDNGCIGEAYKCEQALDWQWGEVYPEEPRLGWTKYLKVIGSRPKRSAPLPDWLNYQAYYMDGTPVEDTNTVMAVGKSIDGCHAMAYLLANGVILTTSGYDNISIWMDINGKKPPNRIGKDQFPFGVGRTAGHYTISPYYAECTYVGSSYGFCSNNCPSACNPDDGKSPTAYVLTHNKLPDLKAMGYPSAP